MKYEMTKPCSNCPFRTDCLKGWLGRDRASEIGEGILRDGTFACHKTTEFDDDGEVDRTDNEQHCAGAMILLEKMNRPNQMMRICERLGMYDRRKMDMESPVFDTVGKFVKHHTEQRVKKTA